MKNTKLYIFLALISSIGIYSFGFSKITEIKIDSLGTLGDFVGGNLNPILTFLSFLALLTTVKLQSEEMAASREELKRSAKAQEESKRILDQQYDSQVLQQFENTFFSLLQQIREVEPNKGRIDMLINSDQFSKNIQFARTQIQRDSDTYSHYFRLIYQTLKFIKTKSLSNSIVEAKFYTNILRSTLTPSQTKILATNSAILPKFTNDNYHSFKSLIEEYCMLEHMHFYTHQGAIDDIALQIYICYKENAFGKNHQLINIKEKYDYRIKDALSTVNNIKT